MRWTDMSDVDCEIMVALDLLTHDGYGDDVITDRFCERYNAPYSAVGETVEDWLGSLGSLGAIRSFSDKLRHRGVKGRQYWAGDRIRRAGMTYELVDQINGHFVFERYTGSDRDFFLPEQMAGLTWTRRLTPPNSSVPQW